jgi:hypothetical protein
MPRVNYESWVKPAKAISFEDDRFVIGCYDDYGRRWLESRLTTMIRRMVECEVGRPVQVEFILLHQEPEEDADVQNVEEEPEGETDELIVSPIYVSIRDAILEPDRIVKMPVYFLRWLPYVGARTIFEVVGLWQEYYLSSHGKQPMEKISLKKQQTLLEQEKSAVPFLSWVLYGIANPSIQDPIGLAVSKLCEQSGLQAGGAFDRLAALPPDQLIQLIQMELAMRYPSNRDWRLVVKSIYRERVILLSDFFGLSVEEGEEVM